MSATFRRIAGLPLWLSLAIVSAASAEVPAVSDVGSANTAAAPSRLDYLVLASMADGSNVLALSARPAPVAAVPGTPQRCVTLPPEHLRELEAAKSGE